MAKDIPIILASASARRKKILRNMGLEFEIIVPDVNEVLISDNPKKTAVDNAISKAQWCRAKKNGYIIAADTVIDFQ